MVSAIVTPSGACVTRVARSPFQPISTVGADVASAVASVVARYARNRRKAPTVGQIPDPRLVLATSGLLVKKIGGRCGRENNKRYKYS